MQINVDVLDERICSKCDDLSITYDEDIIYVGKDVFRDRRYYCTGLGKCKRLKKLLESAKESTPNIEEATSDP